MYATKGTPVTLEVTFCSIPAGHIITSLTNSAQGVMSNVAITPIEDSRCSRVRYTLTVPITIVATNPAGNQIIGTATLTTSQDFVLKVPKSGVVAPQIKSIVSIVGVNSLIVNASTVTTEACITVITKVVADVILVVQTFGYPKIRQCEAYTEDSCARVFDGTNVFPI